jgi:transcriptional regulator NrdR family protein
MNRQSEINAIARMLRPTCQECGVKVDDNHHYKHDQSVHGKSTCDTCHKYLDNRGK